MKVGDLVRYNYKGRNPDNLTGVIVSNYYRSGNGKLYNCHRGVFWACREGIYPIDVKYLELVDCD